VNRTRLKFVLGVVAMATTMAACSEKPTPSTRRAQEVFGPALTADRMPPGLDRWDFGEANEATILRTYSTALRQADQMLRGDQTLHRLGRPAVTLSMTTSPQVAREVAADGLPAATVHHRIARSRNFLAHEDFFSTLEVWMIPDKSGTERLNGLEIIRTSQGASLCDWARKTVGGHPEAERCPGVDIELGDAGNRVVYCAADYKAKRNVIVECETLDNFGTPAERLKFWSVLDDTRPPS
jgi:hypothetical protein